MVSSSVSTSGPRSSARSSVERPALLPGIGVDDRELDLGLVGVEVEEELVDLVHDLGGTGIGAIDLVHDEHHRSRASSAFRRTKRVCGSGPSRIHQQEHPVDHRQALDLPAEVGVPGVSTMFTLVSPIWTAVFLARIVMPFSARGPSSRARAPRPPGSRGTSRIARAGRRRASSSRGRRAPRWRRSEDRLSWRLGDCARAGPTRVPPVRCAGAKSRNR